ncbi:hypothetical protein PsAD5_02395 [Pseudovibrio sp. Ad5]|nr:hypothetical protein PsAD5_02395 [Pseudovibrio sp. Ad5]
MRSDTDILSTKEDGNLEIYMYERLLQSNIVD